MNYKKGNSTSYKEVEVESNYPKQTQLIIKQQFLTMKKDNS